VTRRWWLNRGPTTALGITAALLLVISAGAVRQVDRALEAERWVAHTREVLLHSQTLRSHVTASESAALHYVASGDARTLGLYETATSGLLPAHQGLVDLTRDNLDHGPTLASLRAALEHLDAGLDELVRARQTAGDAGARARLARGDLQQDIQDVRRLLQDFDLHEHDLLGRRLAVSSTQTRQLIAAALGLSFGSLLVLGAAAGTLNRAARLQQTAEARAQSEAAHLRTTLESCGDALIATDLGGRVTLMNPVAAALTGWRPEDAHGLPIEHVFRIVNEFSREPVENPVSKALREGHIVGLANHTILIARDGTERPIDDSGAPIRDANDESLGVILVFRDVSARKRSEQARERLLLAEAEREAAVLANRSKDEFLAVLSHELRNPLAAMLGWLDLIRMGTLDGSGSKRAIESIERAALRQKRLVSDLLDVSRIVSGRFGVERRPFDLDRLVGDCVDECRPEAAAKGLTLGHRRTGRPLVVSGDPERLEQVVENLLSNAVKFTPAGGRIDVVVAAAGDRASVTVADTGAGISAEAMPRLFERFWQARTRATRQDGLGLGLAIVKHIVEEHGGTIAVASDGADRGARFTLELPLEAGLSVEPDDAPAGAHARKSDVHASRLAVLLVDDDSDTREALALLLGERGMTVTEARSVADALDALATQRPDVVVTDIGMPDADGYALLRALRERDRADERHTPAVAVTGYAAGTDRREALAAGFDDHLAKPVEIDALVAKIQALRLRAATQPPPEAPSSVPPAGAGAH
jgi:PAS domain S-box-containing protein